MGATTKPQPQSQPAAPASTKLSAAPSKPQRPGLVTTDGKRISYMSKTGRTLTFEFFTPMTSTNAGRASEVNPFSTLAPLTPASTSNNNNNASNSSSTATPVTTAPSKSDATLLHSASKSTPTTKPSAVQARATHTDLPQKAQLVIRASSKPSTSSSASTLTLNEKDAATAKANESLADKDLAAVAQQNQGVLLGIYDTLSFWCMEAVEVACWGPYDEAAPTPGPGPVAAAMRAAAAAKVSQDAQSNADIAASAMAEKPLEANATVAAV